MKRPDIINQIQTESDLYKCGVNLDDNQTLLLLDYIKHLEQTQVKVKQVFEKKSDDLNELIKFYSKTKDEQSLVSINMQIFLLSDLKHLLGL